MLRRTMIHNLKIELGFVHNLVLFLTGLRGFPLDGKRAKHQQKTFVESLLLFLR